MSTAIIEPPHLAADLKTLCLSTIGAQWRLLAEQAARQRQAPADYLAQLVHLEVTGRRERRIQRRIQDARFPMLKTLDAFSFEAQPDLDRDAILQDRRVVHDAVDDRRGRRRVEEDLGPARERQISRHHQAPALVAPADEAEQQVGAGLVERNVAELVQNNDVEAVELGELAGQPALLLRFDEQRDQLGRGHEPHPVVMLAAGHPQGDGQMRLPGADSADEHDVGGVGDEAAVEDLQTTGGSYRLAAAKRSQAPASGKKGAR